VADKSGWLSEEDYRKLLEGSMENPIPTADFILVREGEDGQDEFMLAKRTENPYKGSWFVAGGRIFDGEDVYEALQRNVNRELGIAITLEMVKLVCTMVVNNPPKMGIRWKSKWYFYTIRVGRSAEIRLNSENSRAKWFTRINRRWPKPVRVALLMAGFDYQ